MCGCVEEMKQSHPWVFSGLVVVHLCEFLLLQSGLLSLQWPDPLEDVRVLDIGCDPGSQRSSCCTCTLCILTRKTTASQIRHNSVTNTATLSSAANRRTQQGVNNSHQLHVHFLFCSSDPDLGIKGGLVPVEQLFHTLANLDRTNRI